MKFKRILLKLSGETLVGHQKFGIESAACRHVAESIKDLRDAGLEVAIVIGGGNIFRGMTLKDLGMQRTPADHIGMLATLINGISLQQSLISIGCPAKVMTALECPRVAETYHWAKALESMQDGNILIFVGGTGNPYFTTDTAAALRASEIHADVFLKATKVDGIYDKDPLKFSDAVLFDRISYADILARKLEVMDATSVAMCMNNRLPMIVFNMKLLDKHRMMDVLSGKQGTYVS